MTSEHPASPDYRATIPRWALGLFLLVALGLQLAVVWPSFYLATDDWMLVTFGREPVDLDRLFARQTGGTPAIRPVSLFLARIEHLIGGDAVFPRLVMNLGWHLAAAGGLYLLLAALIDSRRRAALAAVAFVIWPLHGEVLGWYHSGHTMLPVSAFTLWALAAFVRRWHPATLALLLALGLLTRENAVAALPAMLLIAWRDAPRPIRWKDLLRRCAVPIVVTGSYVLVRAWQVLSALSDDAELPIGQSLVRTAGYLAFHLGIPVHPGITMPWLWLGVAAFGALGALWLVRRELVAPAIWVVLFCLPFAPLYDTGDALFDPGAPGYERRWYHLYLPAAGAAWVAGLALSRLRRELVALVLAGLLALQLNNAGFYARLGHVLSGTFARVEALVAVPSPIAVRFPDETLLSELVEHQLLDIPRVFPHFAAPVYRAKPASEGGGWVRASLDDWGYPLWRNLPPSFRPPPDTRYVHWDDAEKAIVDGP